MVSVGEKTGGGLAGTVDYQGTLKLGGEHLKIKFNPNNNMLSLTVFDTGKYFADYDKGDMLGLNQGTNTI